MNDRVPVSLSGSPVLRHADRARPCELTLGGDPALIEAVTRHVARHVGPVKEVFHEIVSDVVHVDVHHVEPTRERPFHFLITSGMSERPMRPPADAHTSTYAELFMALPASWPMTTEEWRDEAHYWPIRQLKAMARLPHVCDTWLWHGHTVQQSPPDPYAGTVAFNSCILGRGSLVAPRFGTLRAGPDRTVSFFALRFLYPEELQLAMLKGSSHVLARLEKHGVTELVDVSRRNVGRRWWSGRGTRA